MGFLFADTMTTMGGYGLGLLPMIVFTDATIVIPIADKPGIAPGLITGMTASGIGAGFLGGMVGGYLSGLVVIGLTAGIKVPKMDGWSNADSGFTISQFFHWRIGHVLRDGDTY